MVKPGEKYTAADGSFVRPASTFRDFVSSDPGAKYPAEKDRYVLYYASGCPWAHRTLITRNLKGLSDIIPAVQVDINAGTQYRSWYFSGQHGSPEKEPLYGFKELRELYEKAEPSYNGRYTVPVLWDKKTDTLVNNESSEIIRMFFTAFDDLLPEDRRETAHPGGGLYPDSLKSEIDELNEWVYNTVNNGVYKTGFAQTQAKYEENLFRVFVSLDRLEGMLAHSAAKGPFLFGDVLTEADIRLYTTIARFDVGYVPVFMCNLKTIRHDYPHLHLWLRRLYWDGKKVRDQTKGAFHATTAPYIGRYAEGYAKSRHMVVLEQKGPLIIPAGPQFLVEPLPEDER